MKSWALENKDTGDFLMNSRETPFLFRTRHVARIWRCWYKGKPCPRYRVVQVVIGVITPQRKEAHAALTTAAKKTLDKALKQTPISFRCIPSYNYALKTKKHKKETCPRHGRFKRPIA